MYTIQPDSLVLYETFVMNQGKANECAIQVQIFALFVDKQGVVRCKMVLHGDKPFSVNDAVKWGNRAQELYRTRNPDAQPILINHLESYYPDTMSQASIEAFNNWKKRNKDLDKKSWY